MFSRRVYSGRGIGRRLIGLALLASLCASFVPLPMPNAPSLEKDQSQPFPCQNRPCGCASAEQCWKQCCCFTNAQKVVWARENGVTPPDYVVKAARAESSEKIAKANLLSREICSLCKKPATDASGNNKSCCEARDAKSCCSADGSDQREQRKTDEADSEAPRYVIGFEAMKCRGQGVFWNSLPWAVIPSPCVSELPVEPGRWDRPQSATVASVAADPPEPPPRLV
ncbi:hypothetical protein Fuma_00329 [Fuerstiella marisgermanici]|uniref:Uncharacterized protein n=2 Tax=Fuerstiella marisgermanici TaxID=1891926 RepID=A0A1P8W9L0_9PLAN|nr:hypothetical protein Fuma_00329 [Fuerstiella marisgermanici]